MDTAGSDITSQGGARRAGATARGGAGSAAGEAPAGLHVCPSCGSGLVQPNGWEQAEPQGHWKLWRRCPECEWAGSSVHGESEIDDYDEQLDFGTRELAGELRVLERSNMQQAVETFIAALAADLIGPDDFA
ncbi:MAG: hypothetical protein U0R52_05165 [Solirubrobacterales bacterium]